MPIYKRCGRCGKRIESGTKCECKRTYSKPVGIKNIYHSGDWRKVRNNIINKYNGVDIYAWMEHKKFETANTVHHIIPLKEDPNKKYDEDNLLPVSDASHKEIERKYKTEKKEMITKLQDMLKKFASGEGGIKKF